MIEVDVLRRQAQTMVRMLDRGQTAGELAFVMVVNVADRGQAISASGTLGPFVFDATAQQVPECLGTVVVAVVPGPLVELVGQGIVQG